MDIFLLLVLLPVILVTRVSFLLGRIPQLVNLVFLENIQRVLLRLFASIVKVENSIRISVNLSVNCAILVDFLMLQDFRFNVSHVLRSFISQALDNPNVFNVHQERQLI